MSLIDEILEPKNMLSAMMHVYEQKGAAGIDGMNVEELRARFPSETGRIAQEIREKRYKPSPVRRVYIPKPDGKKRPLGIPTVYDRAVQQAVAAKLSDIYEPVFSEYSYGFRPERGCHDAVAQAIAYMDEGYEWVIDLDISKFFDTVCHDKLISILREQVSDPAVLHLVRSYLKAGVMEDGLVSATEMGVPQGGPLSVVLSNIYLDKLDKELESRG
jgi:group II intron reverse transcriptase/maturase